MTCRGDGDLPVYLFQHSQTMHCLVTYPEGNGDRGIDIWQHASSTLGTDLPYQHQLCITNDPFKKRVIDSHPKKEQRVSLCFSKFWWCFSSSLGTPTMICHDLPVRGLSRRSVTSSMAKEVSGGSTGSAQNAIFLDSSVKERNEVPIGSTLFFISVLSSKSKCLWTVAIF